MKKVKIDYDANAKVKVRITYECNHLCCTYYKLDCEELTKELLHIMQNDYDVEVTKN
jgi:hypothetical protein